MLSPIFINLSDKHKSIDGDSVKHKTQKTESEDKLATLKEFRKANGLCFKCDEKWSHNHKCPAQVSLHVIEELLDALEDSGIEADGDEDLDTEEIILFVGHSLDAVLAKRKTMKLCGVIGSLQVLILVDSGSVGSFVSKKLAQQIT